MAVRRKLWLLGAWPGLRQLWVQGSYAGLALAVGFAALVNLLLVAGFVWTEWISANARLVGWGAVLVTWLAAAVATWIADRREIRRQEEQGRDPAEPDGLSEAIDQYLQGKWYETETILRRLLRRDRRDVEAMLMMATLCRHTGRWEEAERRLGELTPLEAAEKWQLEIEHERRLLAARRNQLDQTEDNPNIQERHNSELSPRETNPDATASAMTRAA